MAGRGLDWAGRGLGRAFTQAALGRGDTVVATVRTDDALADLASPRLIRRRLDVADREAVRAVVASVDVPDVVVNNAGYGLVGAIEELSEAVQGVSAQRTRAPQPTVSSAGSQRTIRARLPATRGSTTRQIPRVPRQAGDAAT